MWGGGGLRGGERRGRGSHHRMARGLLEGPGQESGSSSHLSLLGTERVLGGRGSLVSIRVEGTGALLSLRNQAVWSGGGKARPALPGPCVARCLPEFSPSFQAGCVRARVAGAPWVH